MSTNAREHGGHPPADRDEEQDVVDDAGQMPADVAADTEAEAELGAPAVPPILSGRSLLRKGLRRWAVMGVVRLVYRWWTRLAAHLFPEDSRRAAFAARLGIPLPDRLNLSWITPNLAVGGRVLPADIHRLAARGVTRIVDTRAEHMDDKDALAAEHIDLLYLPAPDTKPLTLEQLQEGAAWINQQLDRGERVLVHCEHGVGRSVLLAAAALVACGMNAHDAISLIQRRRWQAAPNHRQVQRLQQFEQAVHNGG